MVTINNCYYDTLFKLVSYFVIIYVLSATKALTVLGLHRLLTMYNALIVPHFNYCLLAWGLNIKAGHKLHLLQKKSLGIIDDNHYIAHTELICKKVQVLKLTDMFRISAWKL